MRKKLLLLVEDNPDDEMLTLRALQDMRQSKEIVVARDGAQALEYVFGQGAHAGRDLTVMPDLILLDIKLPKMSGLEVLERLRSDERTKFIPVVMLSNSSEDPDVRESYRLGANSYIHKSTQFSAFSSTLKDVVNYWLGLNIPISRRI